MIPTGFKLYAGIAAAAFAAAIVGGYSSGGSGVGPLSAGYKGGIGDHVSFVVLGGVAFVAIVVGSLLTLFRDADAEAVAQSMGVEMAPVGQRPVAASIWPIIAGLGVATVVVGLALSSFVTGVGLVVLGIVAFEWTMTAWADRATGDAATNAKLRDQLMGPFEVPLLGLLGGAVLVLAMSRIFLATVPFLNHFGQVIAGTVISLAILALGVLFALKPNMSKGTMTALMGVLVVAVLAAGVWGLVATSGESHEGDAVEEEAMSIWIGEL